MKNENHHCLYISHHVNVSNLSKPYVSSYSVCILRSIPINALLKLHIFTTEAIRIWERSIRKKGASYRQSIFFDLVFQSTFFARCVVWQYFKNSKILFATYCSWKLPFHRKKDRHDFEWNLSDLLSLARASANNSFFHIILMKFAKRHLNTHFPHFLWIARYDKFNSTGTICDKFE